MKMELLAPVGGMEALTAAVRAGADAVYFGAQQFNARRNADNFDEDSLRQAIVYCKTNGVKAYLTLNTLIKDSELAEAVFLAAKAYHFGIDGIIVQDLGLAKVLHQALPQLALHGSTQLSVHSPAALPLLKKLGFKRVVTAREMSEKELVAFCKAAATLEIEVEVFVHGALCMCLSGQCYFSAYLGGRSANRGLCAGTCRLPFFAKGGTGYDLSLKDLSLLDHLETLSSMGVTSLKIEGRMKRPEYVACAVHAFRKALDNGEVDGKTKELLEHAFSRGGFTDGYFTNRLGRDMFGIRSEQDKQLSDDAMAPIHALYRRERQRIPLTIQITIRANQPVSLTAADPEHQITVTGDVPQAALHRPLTEQRVRECLEKLGGTCYFAKAVHCELEQGLMLPISALNQLRKQAVTALGECRSKQRDVVGLTLPALTTVKKRSLCGFFARFASLDQLFAAEQELPTLIGYSLPAEQLAAETGTAVASSKRRKHLIDAWAELPRGAADDLATRRLLTALREAGVTKAVCSNLAAVSLAKEFSFTVMGGFGLNLFNSHALDCAAALAITDAVLSPELRFSEIAGLRPPDSIRLYALCYGRQPLMLTRNCPVKNGVGCRGKTGHCEITDRKGHTFPVICRNGFCEILNTKTTDISDCLESLSVDYGYLYFTTESPQDAKRILVEYASQTQRSSPAFTRGLFKSGVL